MRRLIDADSIKSAKYHDLPYTHIHPVGVDVQAYEMGWNDALDAVIENAPSVDAIEVVRCKDCKFNPKYAFVGCPMSGLSIRDDNDFCSKGERREDG